MKRSISRHVIVRDGEGGSEGAERSGMERGTDPGLVAPKLASTKPGRNRPRAISPAVPR